MSTPICPKCQIPMSLIPSGISKKSGKPYNAFYSCKNRCGTTMKAVATGSPDAQNEPTRVLPQKDGFAVLTEHILALETKVEEMIGLIKEQLSL